MSKVKSKENIDSSEDSDSDSETETKVQKKVEKKKPKDNESDLDVEAQKPKKVEKRKSALSDSDSDDEIKKRKKEKKHEEKKEKKEKPAEKKKAKLERKSASGNAQDGWGLGKDRKVSIMQFKGKTYINIREYYTDAAGDLKPGKKGIALSPEQWAKLLSVSEKVNDASGGDAESKDGWQLGNMRKVSLNEFKGKFLIDIREYYSDAAGDVKPGKKGISLSQDQWEKLLDASEHVNDAL